MPPLGPHKGEYTEKIFEADQDEAIDAEVALHEEVMRTANALADAYGLGDGQQMPWIPNTSLNSEDGTKVSYSLRKAVLVEGAGSYDKNRADCALVVRTSWPHPQDPRELEHSYRIGAYIGAPAVFTGAAIGGTRVSGKWVIAGMVVKTVDDTEDFAGLPSALESNGQLFQDISETLAYMAQNSPEGSTPAHNNAT